MKTKNLIIFSPLILIIVLGSYFAFTKIGSKNLARENIIPTTTNTTKLALCSNKYLATGYGKDGKIIIKNWPEDLSKPVVCAGNLDCPSHERSDFLSFDFIKDLACVQRIEIPNDDSYDCAIVNGENIEKLKSLVNLEELKIFYCDIPNGNINSVFKYLGKLKKLDFHYTNVAKNLSGLKDLSSLEELSVSLVSGVNFDFNNLPISIKKLSLNDFDDKYILKNGDNLANLKNLEEITLPQNFIIKNKDSFCDWVLNWKNIKQINDTAMDLQTFNCKGWVNKLTP